MTYTPHRSKAGPRHAPPQRPYPDRVEPGSYPDDVEPRRARNWIVGGVIVSAGLVGFGAWAVVTTPPQVLTIAVAPGDSPAPGFDVEVTGVRCGVASVGPDGMEQQAAGQFCLLDVEVTNNGAEPMLFDSAAQRVRDTDGEAYAVAEQAAVFLNDHGSSLLNEIEPGETVDGVLPFDMPDGARPSDAELSDGLTTSGVRVNLPDPR
ncbi:hypothetical protein J3R03_008681 [Actinoplanes couchii]|uniref:DUF4352 domain-containing protein n=1 Tax=Actinoplanes couchii TaxID=403638 RepID=UPI001EF31A96|nr:DUF4352 domain-containing protein [Actinoplanes couchii]MDR6324485.1 hypothetical protein [Actinoplanes couchii]